MKKSGESHNIWKDGRDGVKRELYRPKKARRLAGLLEIVNKRILEKKNYSGTLKAPITVRVHVKGFLLAAVACANLPKPSDWYMACDAVMKVT